MEVSIRMANRSNRSDKNIGRKNKIFEGKKK